MKLNDKTKKAVTGASIAAMAVGRPARLGRHREPPSLVGTELRRLRQGKFRRARLGRGHGAWIPVAVAASNNPMLTTLTAAVSGQLNPEVNLVDTLNSGEFTVFAPTDDAFKKIDPATIDSSRSTRRC